MKEATMIPSLDVQIFQRPEAGLALTLPPDHPFPDGEDRWPVLEMDLGQVIRFAHQVQGREFSAWYAIHRTTGLWGESEHHLVFWLCPEGDSLNRDESRAMEESPKELLGEAKLWGRRLLDPEAQPLWLVRNGRIFRVWLGASGDAEPVLSRPDHDGDPTAPHPAQILHPEVDAEFYPDGTEHAFLWVPGLGLLTAPEDDWVLECGDSGTLAAS